MSITERSGAVRVDVYVQPRASRSEVVGPHGDAVKIRLAAPPVDGAANEELTKFLAKLLGLSASAITIVSGATGRRKVVDITGANVADVRRLLGGVA